jgi:hypothetical protein
MLGGLSKGAEIVEGEKTYKTFDDLFLAAIRYGAIPKSEYEGANPHAKEYVRAVTEQIYEESFIQYLREHLGLKIEDDQMYQSLLTKANFLSYLKHKAENDKIVNAKIEAEKESWQIVKNNNQLDLYNRFLTEIQTLELGSEEKYLNRDGQIVEGAIPVQANRHGYVKDHFFSVHQFGVEYENKLKLLQRNAATYIYIRKPEKLLAEQERLVQIALSINTSLSECSAIFKAYSKGEINHLDLELRVFSHFIVPKIPKANNCVPFMHKLIQVISLKQGYINGFKQQLDKVVNGHKREEEAKLNSKNREKKRTEDFNRFIVSSYSYSPDLKDFKEKALIIKLESISEYLRFLREAKETYTDAMHFYTIWGDGTHSIPSKREKYEEIVAFAQAEIDVELPKAIENNAVKVSRTSSKTVGKTQRKKLESTEAKYKEYLATYKHFTEVKKYTHTKAEKATCEKHKISSKTLIRAIKHF